MNKIRIETSRAPSAIGPYSQAIRQGQWLFLSGQIALDPQRMELVGEDVSMQIEQVFQNLSAVAEAAGGSLDDCVKATVYLLDLDNFPLVNEVMAQYFQPPYPARAAIGVTALPKGAKVEIDATLYLPD